MRAFFLLLLALSSLSAHELIYISNDPSPENLNDLQETYKQVLLVNEKKVYLIPSDCRLERYFGGASQLPVKLSKAPEQTQKIILTQEVFESKDESIIKEQLEVEKSIALVEGKVAKAFLDDKEGRGYGGASQVPLDFTFQKITATQAHMKPEIRIEPKKDEMKPYQHPTCQLLDDGSGYRLEHINDARLFIDRKLSPVSNNSILFR